MKDVVHPNSRGYEVLEKELAALLKKMDARFRGGNPPGSRPDSGLFPVVFFNKDQFGLEGQACSIRIYYF